MYSGIIIVFTIKFSLRLVQDQILALLCCIDMVTVTEHSMLLKMCFYLEKLMRSGNYYVKTDISVCIGLDYDVFDVFSCYSCNCNTVALTCGRMSGLLMHRK